MDVIKPSGSDQTVAFIRGDRILVQPKGLAARVYSYQLGGNPRSERIEAAPDEQEMQQKLDAFLQTATNSLLNNTAGVADAK